jgi:hypothetical protein
MRKKTSYFFSAKKNARDVGILAQVRKTVLALYSDGNETGSCRQYRASLPLPMWSSGDSRPPVPWSAEERRREMTNLIANQKGAASTFYTVYAPDDVHDHDVDVTRWASRGVAEAVPLDSCTPRAMPPRACCVLGLCLYRGSA